MLLPIIRGKEDKWFTTVEANICKDTIVQLYILFCVREQIIRIEENLNLNDLFSRDSDLTIYFENVDILHKNVDIL